MIHYCTHGSPTAEGKKDPYQDQQVHHQEDAVDPRDRSISSLRPNVIQPVAVLPLTELTVVLWLTLRLAKSLHFHQRLRSVAVFSQCCHTTGS